MLVAACEPFEPYQIRESEPVCAAETTASSSAVMPCLTPGPVGFQVLRRLKQLWGLEPWGVCVYQSLLGPAFQATSPCGPMTVPNGAYCALDKGIYWDADLLNWMAARHGTFAAATFLAHEYGHLVQDHVLGFRGSNTAIELQADCLAGVFAAEELGEGVATAADVEGARALFCTIGDPYSSPWFSPGAHGSCADRVAAFDHGVTQATACLEQVCVDPPTLAIAICAGSGGCP